MIVLLLTAVLGVTVGPGWSEPILVTDSANTQRRIQLLQRDSQGRFHLIWAGFNDESRIGYKMFLLDGTTVYPETMISRDENSVYLTKSTHGDSLYSFWRESSPVYYAIRSFTDGSEVTPATYLFTTSTLYPYIRACPDSLGRLHVLYNVGAAVHYAVWGPAPGSGFITLRDWVVEGADAGGVLLVDGNRVHLVVQDPVFHTYDYLQYDLNGNTVVPIRDFTANDLQGCGRYPQLNVDSEGNLMVVEGVRRSGEYYRYVLWKLHRETGETLIDEKTVVDSSPPDMYAGGTDHIVRNLPGTNEFYLCWNDYTSNKVFNLLMDGNGDVIVDWHCGYDYSDEDPEDVQNVDGVVDEEGNLYIVYNQAETEPVLGGYPTFGWFDHSYLSVEDEEYSGFQPVEEFSLSGNPVYGSVEVHSTAGSDLVLTVLDVSGRQVSEINVPGGFTVWHVTDLSGDRLPPGIYTIVSTSGYMERVTLLDGE